VSFSPGAISYTIKYFSDGSADAPVFLVSLYLSMLHLNLVYRGAKMLDFNVEFRNV